MTTTTAAVVTVVVMGSTTEVVSCLSEMHVGDFMARELLKVKVGERGADGDLKIFEGGSTKI